MSFATLWNPPSGSGDARRLLVFFITPKLSLGLRQWAIYGAGPSRSDRGGGPDGIIRQGSDLAAIQMQDQVCSLHRAALPNASSDKKLSIDLRLWHHDLEGSWG